MKFIRFTRSTGGEVFIPAEKIEAINQYTSSDSFVSSGTAGEGWVVVGLAAQLVAEIEEQTNTNKEKG